METTQEKKKLPINITFEIVQHPKPNEHWYTVTAVLSWEKAVPDPYYQRMEPCMVTQDELSEIKEATLFLIGERFNIQSVKEETPTYTPGQRVEIRGSYLDGLLATVTSNEEGVHEENHQIWLHFDRHDEMFSYPNGEQTVLCEQWWPKWGLIPLK